MARKLIALIEVRKLMALITILLFSAMALLGRLEVSFVQSVIISIVSFYFGKTTSIDEKGVDR